MHLNYFFLKQVCIRLSQCLTGSRVQAIYSQQKDELVLEFAVKGPGSIIRAAVGGHIGGLSFPDNFVRARRNSVDLFEDLYGCVLRSVWPFRYDRSMAMEFEGGWILVFKLHGNRSNILLWHDGQCRAIFRKQIRVDFNLGPTDLHHSAELNEMRFRELGGRYRSLLPAVGSAAEPWFEAHNYHMLPLEDQWELFREYLRIMDRPDYHLAWADELPMLCLYSLKGFQPLGSDPLEAATAFTREYQFRLRLREDKTRLTKAIGEQISKSIRYTGQARKKLDELTEERQYHQWADIIMANLHCIPAGSMEVVLFDFYNNRPLTIRLNPALTPQKYAENLYRKARNQNIESETLRLNIAAREIMIGELQRDLEAIERIDSPDQLRELKARHLAQRPGLATVDQAVFREYAHMGFRIMVGRSGRNNELLTFGFAKKDDLWLHVKDAPGSHVVVKQKPGQNFPAPVIERAAGLAAHFSKRKNETVCPVTYTPRKYVRKLKGGQPGQVVVEREKVLLVRPGE